MNRCKDLSEMKKKCLCFFPTIFFYFPLLLSIDHVCLFFRSEKNNCKKCKLDLSFPKYFCYSKNLFYFGQNLVFLRSKNTSVWPIEILWSYVPWIDRDRRILVCKHAFKWFYFCLGLEIINTCCFRDLPIYLSTNLPIYRFTNLLV